MPAASLPPLSRSCAFWPGDGWPLPERGGAYAEFADDTADALASGCEGAALALIERSLHAARDLLGVTPALRLHGGGGEALRAHLPAHAWVPDAVLQGLACWHALRIA